MLRREEVCVVMSYATRRRIVGLALALFVLVVAVLTGCSKKPAAVKSDAKADFNKKASALQKAGMEKGWMATKTGGGAKSAR